MGKHTLTLIGRFGLACLFGAAACSGGPDATPVADDDSSGGQVVVQLLETPQALPAFTMTDLDGNTMSPADWQGKVVIVNFWATWCPPCLAEIPDLISLQERYQDRILVIGVSEDDAHVDLRAFSDAHKMNYPIVRSTLELEKAFPGVTALPTTFIIDRDGLMAKKNVGLLNARETEAAARVLSGMEVQNVLIDRVDDPSRLSAESVAQVTDVPGVDFSRVPAESRVEVLLELNAQDCTCGCGLSVAKCRLDDPTCSVSQPLAQTIVDSFSAQ